MRRREFITLAGSATVAWPFAALAEQRDRPARIGYLALGSSSRTQVYDDAFRAGLRELGYVEGQNIHVEFRYAEGDEDRLAGFAAELVDLKVDVILTYSSGLYAAKRATSTIPIVFGAAPDVVAMGIVASLAHPGGNITGLTFFYPELMAKRLELLKTVAPSMRRAGVLLPRDNPATASTLKVMGATAKALQVELQPAEIAGTQDLKSAFSGWADAQIGGFVMSDHPHILFNADRVAAFATERRLPSIGAPEVPAAGALMGYGADFSEMFRRAAALVDKILKGTKPADIPIEQATKFKSVINAKTANALGLSIPPTLFATADEVIE